jgi:hypothetical protein
MGPRSGQLNHKWSAPTTGPEGALHRSCGHCHAHTKSTDGGRNWLYCHPDGAWHKKRLPCRRPEHFYARTTP